MSKLTPAQLSNFLPLTAWGYALWRARSLTLLSGEPFSLAREERLFLSLAQPKLDERWLDIGTSTGFYAGVLVRAGCTVDALDLSPAMLWEAARREGDGIRWLCVNAEQSGLEAESYEGITVGATLNETANPAKMLVEAARLLKPSGRLWLMYAGAGGGLGQRLLGKLGGLTFPDLGWIERQPPGLRLRHSVRYGAVEFALLEKETDAPPQV